MGSHRLPGSAHRDNGRSLTSYPADRSHDKRQIAHDSRGEDFCGLCHLANRLGDRSTAQFPEQLQSVTKG